MQRPHPEKKSNFYSTLQKLQVQNVFRSSEILEMPVCVSKHITLKKFVGHLLELV